MPEVLDEACGLSPSDSSDVVNDEIRSAPGKDAEARDVKDGSDVVAKMARPAPVTIDVGDIVKHRKLDWYGRVVDLKSVTYAAPGTIQVERWDEKGCIRHVLPSELRIFRPVD